MLTLTPLTQFGKIPQELADLRFSQQNAALIVDLIPRDMYYGPLPDSPSESESLLQEMGAKKIVPGKEFLRLKFDYIDGLVYCGPDETADVLTNIPDRDSGPSLEDQSWPYPLLKVENSSWSEHMLGPIEHFRMIGPFFTLDVLGYEPTGSWEIAGRTD